MLAECTIVNGKRKPHAPLTSFLYPFVMLRLLDIQTELVFSAEIYHGTQYKCE